MFLIGTVVICLLGDAVVYGLTIPILPSLLIESGAREHDLQALSSLVITIHAGSSMLCFPAAGVFSDRTKTRKLPIIIGVAIFTTVST